MITLTPGSEDLAVLRKAMEVLEDEAPLRKFVYAFANVDPVNGGRITTDSRILEGVLFAVWLEACAVLNVCISNPTITLHAPDEEEDEDDG
jgi:hypothetical protein